MNSREERERGRTLLKLSKDARLLWEETTAVYADVRAMRDPQSFANLRRKRDLLPRNQQRYYRRLVRLDSERFYRAAMLAMGQEEFNAFLEGLDYEELVFVAGQLGLAMDEYLGRK